MIIPLMLIRKIVVVMARLGFEEVCHASAEFACLEARGAIARNAIAIFIQWRFGVVAGSKARRLLAHLFLPWS